MATQIENLWGEEIIVEEDFTLPKTILMHQANYLKKISRNILQGEIISSTDEYGLKQYDVYDTPKPFDLSKYDTTLTGFLNPDDFYDKRSFLNIPTKFSFNHDFYIKSSSANYKFKLLGVSHNIELYPLIVHGYLEEKHTKADNEEEFKNVLSQLFRSPKTQRVLNILTVQAKS